MNAKAGTVLIEQFEGVLGEPAIVSKLKHSGRLLRQKLDKGFEQVEVLVEAWRQLV